MTPRKSQPIDQPSGLFSLLHTQRRPILLSLVWTLVLFSIAGGLAYWAQAGSPTVTVFFILWIAGLVNIGYITFIHTRREKNMQQIQEELGSLRHFNDLLLNHAGEGIMGIDLAGQVTFLNPAAAEMLDFQAEFLIGKFIHPIIQHTKIDGNPFAWEESAIFLSMQNEEIHTVDNQIFWMGNGGCFPVEFVCSPVFEEDSLEGAVIAFKDITERRKTELALRDSEALFESLVENLPQNIYRKNLQGRFTFTNKRFCQTIGHTPDAILGNTDFDFFPAALAEKYVKDDDRVILEQEIFETIEEHQLPNGKKIYVQVVKTPVYDSQGMIVGTQGIFWDVSDQKQVEEDLKLAKQEADRANRTKSEFLANISHEIRTPMNAILGMTELALETQLTEEQENYLKMVKDSAESLLRLINDILDFSKMEAGRLDIYPIDFILRDSISETLHSLALRTSQKNVELLCHVLPNVPDALIGDPGRLRQIIVNLVGNSIKFTEKGEIEVKVELENETDEEASLYFTVRDTGIGIPAAKQSLIFKAFEQVDSSSTRHHGGTGLGLTICSKLVELMQGRIWLESPCNTNPSPGEGIGSAFHFTAVFHLQNKKNSKINPCAIHELENLHVLMVDDNATSRCIVREMLTNWRLKPELAEDAFIALDVLKKAKAAKNPFRIMIADVNMPGMDGFTLAQKVKNNPDLSDTLIMMLTSSGIRGDADRCKQLGISAYLTKPVKQSDLLDSIMNVLSLKNESNDTAPLITRHTLRESQNQLHILLAEDNPVNQQLAMKLLEKRGHCVILANNGKEAIEALKKEEVDVIFMDVQMPEMDGFEATTHIRTIETYRHIPIIAMTAHAMKGDRDRCLEAGMDEYISKPIRADQLYQILDTVIKKMKNCDNTNQRNINRAANDCHPEDIVNIASMMQRVEGDKEIILEIASILLEEAPQMLKQVQEAVAEKDAKKLEYSAHSLKGVVSNFSAEKTFAAALQLEEMGRSKDLTGTEEILQNLEYELSRLIIVVQKINAGVIALP